jgi:hypothetical protein
LEKGPTTFEEDIETFWDIFEGVLKDKHDMMIEIIE